MSSVDWVAVAKAAKDAAQECINGLRRAHRGAHFIHREVEVLAIDMDGERHADGEPLAYIPLKELSGKKLAQVVRDHAPAQYHHIAVQGGCDGYNSFADFMAYPDDYDPWCDAWDIDTNDLPSDSDRVPGSATQVVAA